MRLTLSILCAVMIVLAGCSSPPIKEEPYIQSERAKVLAPHMAELNHHLDKARVTSEPAKAMLCVEKASAYGHVLQATLGPAKRSGLSPEETAEELGNLERVNGTLERLRAEREARAAAEKIKEAEWQRVKSMFWMILIGGAISGGAMLFAFRSRAYAGYCLVGAACSGVVLLFSSLFRTSAENLAGGVWALVWPVLILSVIGGVAWYFLYKSGREKTKET